MHMASSNSGNWSKLESAESQKKNYPLHKVVEYGNIHKIKIMLPQTKNINEKDDDGNTVLHLACEHSTGDDILDLLLNCDEIDVSLLNSKGLTALHSLAFKGNLLGIIKLLKKFPSLPVDIEAEGKVTPLIMATLTNRVDVIRYLLTAGANVDHATSKKFTALHYAANNGYASCAQVLINNGADVNARDDYQQTPLMKSSKWGFLETCKVLLASGANINLACAYGFTALTQSCQNDRVEVTKLLISYGANVNFPGPYSVALFRCSTRGSLECAKELLNAGVNVTGKTGKGNTALSLAQKHGNKDIVEFLRPFFP